MLTVDFNGQRAFRAALEHFRVNSVYKHDDEAFKRLGESEAQVAVSKWLDQFTTFDRWLMNLRFTPVATKVPGPLRVKKMPHSSGEDTELFRLGIDREGSNGLTAAERNHYTCILGYIVSAVMKRWLGTGSNGSYVAKYLAMIVSSTLKVSPESADHLAVMNLYLANDEALQHINYWQVKNSGVTPNAMTFFLTSLYDLERVRPQTVYRYRDVGVQDLVRGTADYEANNSQAFILSEVEQDLTDHENIELQFVTSESTKLTSGKEAAKQAMQPSFDRVIEDIDRHFFSIAFQKFKEIVEVQSKYDQQLAKLDFEDQEDFKLIAKRVNLTFNRLIDDKAYQERVIQAFIEHFQGDVRQAYANIIPQIMFHAGRHPVRRGELSELLQLDTTLSQATKELVRYAKSMTVNFNSQAVQKEIFAMVADIVPSFRGACINDFFDVTHSTAKASCPYQRSNVGAYFYNFSTTLSDLAYATVSAFSHVVSRATYAGHCLPDAQLEHDDVVKVKLELIPVDVFQETMPLPDIITTSGPTMKFVA